MATRATPFLPTSREEMNALGWKTLDVLLVSGDAYVDHPSFGAALIGRHLESLGYRVGILPQPDWRNPEAFLGMGVPRLFVGVTSGAMDSMVNHYTSLGKPRQEDHYSEGGLPKARPDRAVLVYVNRIREAMPGVPVVIGGVEASLRRVSHYDFWSDRIRKSVLLDSKATILVYGMGERAVAEIARRLEAGQDLEGIPGTAFYRGQTDFQISRYPEALWLPDHEELEAEAEKLLQLTGLMEQQSQPWMQRVLLQRADSRVLILFPPARPLTSQELDRLYALPFSRRPHPRYKGEIPAFTMVRDSVTVVRGCAGGCSFCSIALHQGRVLQSRTKESVLEEIKRLAREKAFSGTISDLGGPSANMYGLGCTSGFKNGKCLRPSCLFPEICAHLSVSQEAYMELLNCARALPGVKHLFVSSGIRHDLALREPEFLELLVRHHVSGHLKVAPEHASSPVLARMRKPPWSLYRVFQDRFRATARRAGKELYLVPYLMAGFPGCSMKDMDVLERRLRESGLKPRQVQLFLPTPMTMATAMYWSGMDPSRGEAIYVPRTHRQRKGQLDKLLYWRTARSRGTPGSPTRDHDLS